MSDDERTTGGATVSRSDDGAWTVRPGVIRSVCDSCGKPFADGESHWYRTVVDAIAGLEQENWVWHNDCPAPWVGHVAASSDAAADWIAGPDTPWVDDERSSEP